MSFPSVNSFQTLNAKQLGVLLNKRTNTVWSDLSRAPERLPPAIRIAGTRQTLWLESTVHRWLQERQVEVKVRRGRPTKRQQIERAAAAGGSAE